MARIRSIHPGLTSDEAFMQMSISAKAAWPLLWMECDDHGVFEWKPIVLKARLFPADNIDFGEVLMELAELGCVMPFDHDGKRYGVVKNFCAYQRPKNPSYRHPCPGDVSDFAKSKDSNPPSPTPALPQPYPSPTENPPQRKEEGGRMDKKEAASAASAGAVATPASPKRDRAWVLALEDRLRAAAGLENDPSPNLSVIGPITGLMDAGADLEVDILPVIRAKSKAGAKPRSWSFFTGAIQDAMKARHAAGEPLVVRQEPPGETHAEKRKRLGMPDPETRDLGWWKPKVETFYRCREWVDWMCGPPPGDPGCLAPQEWIDMYRPKPRIVA